MSPRGAAADLRRSLAPASIGLHGGSRLDLSQAARRPLLHQNSGVTIDLERARELGARESGLAVVVTYRADGSAHASVVNAGVLSHPVSGEPVVGFVVRGHATKLTYLRRRPRATVVFRSGWDWIAVEGSVDLAGPDDLLDGLPTDAVPTALRTVYAAAVGGTTDDWAQLDAEMTAEGHTAAFVRPTRIYAAPVTRR